MGHDQGSLDPASFPPAPWARALASGHGPDQVPRLSDESLAQFQWRGRFATAKLDTGALGVLAKAPYIVPNGLARQGQPPDPAAWLASEATPVRTIGPGSLRFFVRSGHRVEGLL